MYSKINFVSYHVNFPNEGYMALIFDANAKHDLHLCKKT